MMTTEKNVEIKITASQLEECFANALHNIEVDCGGTLAEIIENARKYRWHDLRKNPNDLPEHLKMVNVAWVNRKPAPYYSHIKDKPFEASAVCFHGEWYWWSVFCEDMLSEYGRNDADEIDDGIEIIAWREIEPYKGVEE